MVRNCYNSVLSFQNSPLLLACFRKTLFSKETGVVFFLKNVQNPSSFLAGVPSRHFAFTTAAVSFLRNTQSHRTTTSNRFFQQQQHVNHRQLSNPKVDHPVRGTQRDSEGTLQVARVQQRSRVQLWTRAQQEVERYETLHRWRVADEHLWRCVLFLVNEFFSFLLLTLVTPRPLTFRPDTGVGSSSL